MRITLTTLQKMAREGDPITMLTCYDASFATLLDNAGVDTLLVGDSLGNVIKGEETTLAVTLEEMAYHTRCVARGAKRALVIADMPFGTFQVSPEKTFENAVPLMAAGAHMVKLEGGREMAETVAFLTRRGVPVCGHIGLTPQSVHQLGGFKVQGRGEAQAAKLLDDAKALEEAGAGLLVLEAVPAALAKQVTASIRTPTIGIGAGPDCSGQVLVLYDMLDLFPGRRPKFVRSFMRGAPSVQAAIEAFVKAVKDRTFPGPEETFQ
ncbi:MAG: 3-methyl-2-oxobutanoate hydroxymethyltransferase [Azospira oryzae]|uniref:3-methyl-2-oxobutanoate hydroxymethyltransferase n=1 Tax=Pelomicrobium methylotrophicum TaxID=2602750 RepID=A0A5C7EJ60_9PROT|nr:3-methyl-2-oxobutanoate hydroxymethyltransferase [Pelomicrobium methylotrophicum]PZP55907.1 MAG: 3-methyl-2-oxobutanoate hydroxymethyltransferase [Azospira oryzae]PZP78189.1 MAG: 3-methyl-2-oxobutanoate hydroxymethyltransferase [Azospira oryzae]TXF11458.1 3-methyl-2-oxobutanoate hydroxymethyltransferase [Pelomicrobium methylotrophicum]